MREELMKKIASIQKLIDAQQVGSLQHTQLTGIKKELEKELSKLPSPVLKIHVDPNQDICESCQ